MAYNPRKCLWFGTEDYMTWVQTPNQGAEGSPDSWHVDGTLLSGGGYALGSWGSHKVYTYEWPSFSAREAAQLMKSFSDGSYGKGLLYFVEPLVYTTNVLAARVADPSMSTDNEGGSMVYGMIPEAVATSGWEQNMLPIQGAYYDLASVTNGFRGVEEATFVPIPQGYTLYLGAFYEFTGSGGIFATPLNTNGTLGTAVKLTDKSPSDSLIVEDDFTGVRGVYLWLGKSSAGASSVTARALIGRLIANEEVASAPKMAALQAGPWIGGQGHSGCRFLGKPTYISNSPINGGQIEYAASFREVGSFAYG